MTRNCPVIDNAYKQGKLVDLPVLGSIYLETE
jgi:hypothetical protein